MRAQESTILNFIGGLKKVFIIPPFQRNYEWKQEQCEELFEDIENACKTGKSHYLGNIVYYEGRNSGASYSENILIDGQQRVTTILILLCAIRDSMDPVSNQYDILDINRMYLRNENAPDDYRVRLKQTDYDNGCYERIVDGTFSDVDTGKLASNYRKFLELIKNSEKTPKELYETIPNLEVVGVNLQIDSDLAAVQTIFEKINSTGKPLSAADLLRNYLLICDNSKEQERLYKNYWVKIEEIITTDYISAFVRDYLIMKICEFVEKGNVYKEFKEYVENNSLSHEDVLDDMRDYASSYKVYLMGNSGNKKLDSHIEILKTLGTDDIVCLFVYLLQRCKAENVEPEKIFLLLKDFMIRYRIVGVANGGGDLRAVAYKMIDKLEKKEISCDFESIYFELSNSANPSGRFPDDIEFKTALMKSVQRNHKYGRTILLAIEEKETKNIPVPFSQVTIEHLMPQTLSDWWVKYLGGKEEAGNIVNNYLNCIGNLAPLSGKYNSENSNRPWNEKIEIMQSVQFKTTQEVTKLKQWKIPEIERRNDDISDRACKAIMAPLERTRAYTNQKTFDDFESGDYPITDLDTQMNGTEITSVSISEKTFEIENWNQLLVKISEYLVAKDKEKFGQIVKDNLLHKEKKTKNPPCYDPIITTDKKLLNTAKKISDTDWYCEGNISSSRARFFSKQLLDQFDLADSCIISVKKKTE